jgi:glycosyltransferase involved in cell wall biosynthesis
MNRRVTIVVSTYNRVNELPQTLKSLLAQDYDNFDIMIVDNGSDDDTIQYLNELEQPKLKIVSYDTNLGYHRNLIRAIKSAHTEFVAAFHSDDIYFSNIISSMVGYLEDDNVGAVFCGKIDIDSNALPFLDYNKLTSLKTPSITMHNQETFLVSALRTGTTLAAPTFFTKKSVINNIFFEEKENYSTDLDLWIPILKKYQIIELDSKLMFYVSSKFQLSYLIHNKRTSPSPEFSVLDNYVRLDKSIHPKHLVIYFRRRFFDSIFILNNSFKIKRWRIFTKNLIYSHK